jgi:uncharacterized protein YycO
VLRKIKHLLVQFFGKIWIPHRFQVDKDYAKIIAVIAKPGDIILSRTHWRLSNLAIPGRWKHVAVVGAEGMVIEAVQPVVRCVSLVDMLCEHDEVALYRFLDLVPEVRQRIALSAAYWIGVSYDEDFDEDPSDLYCTELAIDAFKEVMQPPSEPCWVRRFFGIALPVSFTDGRYFIKLI